MSCYVTILNSENSNKFIETCLRIVFNFAEQLLASKFYSILHGFGDEKVFSFLLEFNANSFEAEYYTSSGQ